jgi:hypothetical protein
LCVSCNSNVSSSSVNNIKCCKFRNIYHLECTDIGSPKKLQNLGINRNSWKCIECSLSNIIVRINITNSSTVKDESIDSLSLVKADISSILSKIENLVTSTNSVEKSITICSDKIDDFNSKLDSEIDKVNDVEYRLSNMENKYKNLINDLELLKNNSSIYEQNDLANNIEISGIPFSAKESLNEVIIYIGKKLNVDIKNSDLSKLYRLKSNNQGKIVIHFSNKITKIICYLELKLHISQVIS